MIQTVLLLCLLLTAGPSTVVPALTPAPPPAAPAADTIQPDRPGIADGSLVIGPRRFQVEIGLQQEFRSGSRRDEQRLFVPTLLRFGLDNRWEARIETNALTYTWTSESGTGVHRTFGYSPVSVGTKYHFQDAKPQTGNLSLGAILR